jgi:hypothetical protein
VRLSSCFASAEDEVSTTPRRRKLGGIDQETATANRQNIQKQLNLKPLLPDAAFLEDAYGDAVLAAVIETELSKRRSRPTCRSARGGKSG